MKVYIVRRGKRDAVMDSFKQFLLDEAAFRIDEMFQVHDHTEKLVEDVANVLYNKDNIILNYDVIDNLIAKELERQGVEYGGRN